MGALDLWARPHPEETWGESSVVDAISVSARALSIRAVRLWKYSLLPHTTLHSLEFFGRHSMPSSEVPLQGARYVSF